MQDFRRLRVWQGAHRTALLVYRITAGFPRSESFGITSQLRRSAASIGANVAEGCGRASDADTCRFLQIALGSACETLNHLLLARDLGLLDAGDFARVEAELLPVRRMLTRLIQRLRTPAA
jgi:four helix bundle protein